MKKIISSIIIIFGLFNCSPWNSLKPSNDHKPMLKNQAELLDGIYKNCPTTDIKDSLFCEGNFGSLLLEITNNFNDENEKIANFRGPVEIKSKDQNKLFVQLKSGINYDIIELKGKIKDGFFYVKKSYKFGFKDGFFWFGSDYLRLSLDNEDNLIIDRYSDGTLFLLIMPVFATSGTITHKYERLMTFKR